MVRVEETLRRLGGCATFAELVAVHHHRRIRAACRAGLITRVGTGRYVLPSVDEHRREAHRRTAVLSHLSAAAAHGWKLKHPPDRPWLIVPRNRNVPQADRATAHVHWADLEPREMRVGVTSPLRTVLDCARSLPFDEALAVADSALRAGDVGREQLRRAAARLRGPGAGAARRVAAHADGRAANPFESVLRAIVLDVPGLSVIPQVEIAESGCYAVADLADTGLRLVIEAEGFEFHGTRKGLVRDCRRYTELTVFGWSILRFTWAEVMFDPTWVRWAITGWLATLRGEPVPRPPAREARPVAV